MTALTVCLGASQTTVFQILCDASRRPHWLKDCHKSELITPLPFGEESKIVDVSGKRAKRKRTHHVSLFDPPHQMVLETRYFLGSIATNFLLDEADGETRLIVSINPLALNIGSSLAARVALRRFEASVADLQDLCLQHSAST